MDEHYALTLKELRAWDMWTGANQDKLARAIKMTPESKWSQKMGRRSVSDMLPAARRVQAVAIAQTSRHASLSTLKTILFGQMGLEISRSAIRRNIRKTDASGQTMAQPEKGTVVTIVGCATGEARIVKTRLPGAVVEDLICRSSPAGWFHPL